jgi:hypothetical protein
MHETLERDGRTVYVPTPESPLRRTIVAGSGIVGTALPDSDKVLIDYEGGIYNQAGFDQYDNRVYHAYDRHTFKPYGYPTVARMLVDAHDLIGVGIFDPERRTVHVIRQDELDEWLAGRDAALAARRAR